ncbi:ATP-binding protein [Calothrix rhizosoleniae]|uniref:ATP-binding protein n=1 Tax=Calothrix rhizosoleniae TaxID=888997 RepID=UPI000B4A3C09|nr:ATP-binding protein [Calothrix rhizosoleniae]
MNIDNWYEANHHYILAAVAVARGAVEKHAARDKSILEWQEEQNTRQETLLLAAKAMPATSSLDKLCTIFQLSKFERNILLLCACMELSSNFHILCAKAHGETQRTCPTFSLAFAAFPEPHWDAIAPHGTLRRWRLIEVGDEKALTLAPLRLDERILHYLVGVESNDERLTGLIESFESNQVLVSSHQKIVQQIVSMWSYTRESKGILPVVQLCGTDTTSKCAIASEICKILGRKLKIISAPIAQSIPSEVESLIRLWEREAILSESVLFLNCDKIDSSDATRVDTIEGLIERINGFLFVASQEKLHITQRPVISVDICHPTTDEQRLLWKNNLNQFTSELNGQVKKLIAQFNLSPAKIHSACVETTARLNQQPESDLGTALWDACRVQARPRLDELAQRITATVNWQNLVLPPAQSEVLDEIAAHVRQKYTVYQEWGFGTTSSRGLGISALFAGPSGTGKTLASEVLAQKLSLDLYRIDLSSVISKYIGETEKNLRRVFDAAQEGGVILLFDEADALFGKRSEVKDSRDRYANIEVSYLLQRMECYPGLAILTTNFKNSIDTAFMRRIRFLVQFPFPDAAQRAKIWQSIFPKSTPVENLDIDKLARLNVTGGNIRNIALNAAFLAADSKEPVQMKHILRAARTEYIKLEKSLTEAEISGWV